MTVPRFTTTGSDAEGWTVRLVAGNGEVVLSSSSQVYADERDAARAVEIAREAVGGGLRARVEAAFSGGEFEENANAAAQEGEWSWFRWLALTALDAALTDAAEGGEEVSEG